MPRPLTITTPSDREIVVVREFDAPRELVFRCFTVPELIRRWYGLPDWEMIVCEFDARIGGKWRFVTKAPSGYEMGSSGLLIEFQPPTRIVNNETYDEDWTGGETVVTTLFDEQNGHTNGHADSALRHQGSSRRRARHADGDGHGDRLQAAR